MNASAQRWGAGVLVATLVALAVLLVPAGPLGSEARGQAPLGEVTVSVDASQLTLATGESFTLRSEVTNSGTEATPALIANLGFVAVDHDTYVDPEDWSSQRTVAVDPIPAGGTTIVTWQIRPVLAGDVAAYIVILPEDPALAGAQPIASSPAVAMHITEHREINPGGVLPVVLIVPGLVAAAGIGLRLARRRG